MENPQIIFGLVLSLPAMFAVVYWGIVPFFIKESKDTYR